MYGEVHLAHHNTSTYGTEADPEYLPFSGKPVMILVFILQGILLPALLFVRAFILAPLGLLMPPVRRWTLAHGSALSMNIRYIRVVTPAMQRSILGWEAATVGMWGLAALFLRHEGVLLSAFAAWYAIVATVAVVNTLRTLAAHRYEGDGSARSRDEQLLDSIDTPGGLLTGLWAPVGLRFHALHHYFPGIPYHNLRKAHERLVAHLPPHAPYRATLSRSLVHSLLRLARGSSS
jgi:fatty acid desaturase